MSPDTRSLEEDIAVVVPIRLARALGFDDGKGDTAVSGLKLGNIQGLYPTFNKPMLRIAVMSAIKDKASPERREALMARAEEALADFGVWNLTTHELVKKILS